MKAVFCLVLSVSILLGGCNRKSFLKRSTYNKTEINTLLDKTDMEISARFTDRKKRLYKVRKTVLEEYTADSSEFQKVLRMKAGKLYGPFPINDSMDYFLKKIDAGEVFHFKTTAGNIHQPPGMSDETYSLEIQKIKNLCLSGIPFEKVKDQYESENPVKLGLILPYNWLHEKDLTPEVSAFLKTAKSGDFFQTEKVSTHYVQYSTLIVKTAENRTYKSLTFVRLTVKNIPDEK